MIENGAIEVVHEKIEMGVLDPIEQVYKGGSWKVEAIVPQGLSDEEKEEIKEIIDSFDHSTLFPAIGELEEIVKKEKLEKLFHRFTIIKDLHLIDRAPNVIDMCAVIYGELHKKRKPVVRLRMSTDDGRFDFIYTRNAWEQVFSSLVWEHVVNSG